MWDASDSPDLPEHCRTIVKLLILTGQRRGEIAALGVAYISWPQATITLPQELTKNGREHTFPIGPLTVSLLKSRLDCSSSGGSSLAGLLFLARGKPSSPFNGWSKSKALLEELSDVTGWTLHDLRRTYRSTMGRLGIAPHIAERLVNHVTAETDTEHVYDLYKYLPEMTAAVAVYESHLQTLLYSA